MIQKTHPRKCLYLKLCKLPKSKTFDELAVSVEVY